MTQLRVRRSSPGRSQTSPQAYRVTSSWKSSEKASVCSRIRSTCASPSTSRRTLIPASYVSGAPCACGGAGAGAIAATGAGCAARRRPEPRAGGGQHDMAGGVLGERLPGGGEVPDQQVGDGGGLLHRHQVAGARHDGEPGVGDAGDQGAGLGGPGDLVLGAHEHESGNADAAEPRPYVEGGERLAGGDVAAGVGGAHHLHGPLGDRGLGGGEPAGEPAFGRGAGDRVEAVGAHDHAALAELVGGAEAGRGGDQREGREALRVAQGQLDADGAAEGAAGVPEPVDADALEGGEQPRGEVGDGGRGGGRGRRRARGGRTGTPATASSARGSAGPTCARWYRGTDPGSEPERLPARRSGIAGCSVVSRSPVRPSHVVRNLPWPGKEPTAPTCTQHHVRHGTLMDTGGAHPAHASSHGNRYDRNTLVRYAFRLGEPGARTSHIHRPCTPRPRPAPHAPPCGRKPGAPHRGTPRHSGGMRNSNSGRSQGTAGGFASAVPVRTAPTRW